MPASPNQLHPLWQLSYHCTKVMELTPPSPLRTFTYTSSKKLAPLAPSPVIYVSKNEKKIPHDRSEPIGNLDNDWQTYRTRFTIRARILSAPLSFVDALGREQNGKRGDYLVESNGMVTITSRHIFEDVYVALDPAQTSAETIALGGREQNSGSPPRKSPISTKKSGFFVGSRRRSL
jgi:hypothetical protein